MPIWIGLLLSLLGWLVQWLWNRHELTEYQKDKINVVMFRMAQVEKRACFLGCERGGWPELKSEKRKKWWGLFGS